MGEKRDKMNKKMIPVWVILIGVVGVLLYSFLFWKIFNYSFKYEVEKDGTILIDKEKFTISNEIKSYYDSDKEAFYIVGTFKNNTAKQYTDITLNFAVYDLNGNILGNAYAHLDQIDKNETWKFKANYDDVDATDAVSYKLIEVEYY